LETFRCGDGSRIEMNQKMKFDIDLAGNFMGVGDQVRACESSQTTLS
jgi:hypothetical protein